MTWAVKSETPQAGLFLESEATFPRLMSLTETSWRGSLRGLSVGLVGGSMASMASKRVIPVSLTSFLSTFFSMFHPLYQGMLVEASNMLSPAQPEMGTKATEAGLYPTFLMKPDTSFWISSNLAPLYGGSVESILLTATMSCLTPRV